MVLVTVRYYLAWVEWVWAVYGWHLILGYVGVLLMLSGLFWKRVGREDASVHGTARWGTKVDAHKAGLLQGPGIVLGKLDGQVLRFGGDQSVLFVGPARSGKTNILRQTLRLAHQSLRTSVIALDLKGTFQQTMPDAYVFAPSSRRSEGINPMDAIRWGMPEEVGDCARMAQHIYKVPATETSDKAMYYQREGRLLLQAGLLVIGHEARECHENRTANLIQVMDRFAGTADPIKTLQDWRKMSHQGISKLAGHALTQGREVHKIWSGATGFLMPWVDPLLAAHMAHTTFPWRDLQTGPTPMSLILQLKPDDLLTWHFLLPMLLDQFLLTQTYRHPRDRRHELLVVLDDMAEMGYAPVVEHIPAFYGEHGLRLIAVFQSFDQCWKVFGQHFSVLDNSAAWVLFRPGSPPSAEFMTRKLSTTTATTIDVRRSGSWFGRKSYTTGEVSVARDLVTSGEMQRLAPGKVLVSVYGVPYLCDTIRWDEEVRV